MKLLLKIKSTNYRLSSKSWKVMKLASIFFIALTMQVSAAASSQTVTYSGKNIAFKKMLNVIKTQTDYVFFYDSAIAKDAKPVSLNVVNEPLESVLEKAFANADFTYVIQGKTISLIPNPAKVVKQKNSLE